MMCSVEASSCKIAHPFTSEVWTVSGIMRNSSDVLVPNRQTRLGLLPDFAGINSRKSANSARLYACLRLPDYCGDRKRMPLH